MRVSYRAEEMKVSPIRKLLPHAIEAKKKGIKVNHLNIGQPDTVVPNEFFEAISGYKSMELGYESSNGNRELIKSNLAYYKKNHLNYHSQLNFVHYCY